MPAATEATGPTYISSHSADVILSDIRPIKLKLEGLRSINVLLDEFLFNILNTSRSLSTDKLRAGLLTILPTSLGKEALLEAEVELRAYWDRTPRPAVLDDDTQSFNLQWAFELLRLKCEAYSTLNETDEDPVAVAGLQEKMTQLGGTTPPVAALVAPASLYLTAILESMCEHILSNVGRVAARDSSRTGATVQDVFVALCEDHSIYALFKSMRVYQQIEQLAQAPKPRRSKSFSRSDRPSLSNPDQPSSGRDSTSQHRSRPSTDTTSQQQSVTPMPLAPSTSRSSFDKARKKLLPGSRSSTDQGESQNGHKRSESLLSDETKQMVAAYNDFPPEDSAMQKEFDNLMRSDQTMKVSLTPDRLKTMEVYKQEKDQRGNRRPPPLAFGKGEQADSSVLSRANGRRPSLRNVDSIVEDEEEASKSTPTPRKNNITSPPNLPSTSTSTTSISSTSNSSTSRVAPRKSSRSNLPSSESTPPMPVAQPKRGPSGPAGFDPNGFPPKTRRVQKNREDMDLDDIMAGSDDEDEPLPAPAPRTPSKAPTVTPKRTPASPGVSASTRELMDFLNEGPPDVPKVSASGRDMMDFLAQGPPDQGGIAGNGMENGKKGSGRLQRMMSKLSMGTSERSRSQASEDYGRGKPPPTTPIRTTAPGLAHQTSYGNLANRPVPPRPPPVQPISPPSSPSEEDYGTASTRSRKASVTQPGQQVRRVMPTWEQQMADGQAAPAVPGKSEQNGVMNGNVNGAAVNGHSRPSNGHAANGANGTVDEQAALRSRRPSAANDASKRALPKPVVQTAPSPSPTTSRRLAPTPSPVRAPAPVIAEDHARDMRRLLSRATNADECRLIFEIFLAKAGVAIEPAPYEVPYPSPPPSDTHATAASPVVAAPARDASEVALELSLVELFLGGGVETQISQAEPRKQRRPQKQVEPVASPIAASAPVAQATSASGSPRKYAETSTVSGSRRHTPPTASEVGP